MKQNKKAIKVIKEFALLVEKLIELKKLSVQIPEYKKQTSVYFTTEDKNYFDKNSCTFPKDFFDKNEDGTYKNTHLANDMEKYFNKADSIDSCSDECFNNIVNNDAFIKGVWDKNMFSMPVKEKEITDITVLVGGLPVKFTIDKNVITILDLDNK